MHGHEAGNAMGINTWAAFAGSDEKSVADRDFVMLESEVQSVLKALGAARINIVARYNSYVDGISQNDFPSFLGRRLYDRFGQRIKSGFRSAEEIRDGIGNSVLGIKWRFFDEERQGIAISTYPRVEFNTANSSLDKGLVDKGPQYILPLEIERKIGPVNVNGEVAGGGQMSKSRRKDGFSFRARAGIPCV